ncbi:MAG: S8 family serine peptidase [Candidatus Marinimicrobia bacterium]|jgi:minor extracellular serine protease Vpr|nr:S8 family serine peptidase [Candidatus Neomarinimicrobiota bacterium]MBT4360663.1 S8 family serine peptidase [Candidatus Neomarinimicrobiota bacterium]MBT4715919.1 S8 family serine peptidase [Candidatus Neomarinimicrobiota bacterium]MBT4948148.1 S8 family serine peptidase [Candidatus Neomarinimicrobiota bacterium]MBT5271030.1 S8 family serine peptidase [Candidatus Neomarinimicrobiota bacterium]
MNNTICKTIFLLMIPAILFSENIYNPATSKLSFNLQKVVEEQSSREFQFSEASPLKARTVKGPSQEVLYPVTIRSTDIEAIKVAGIRTNSDYPGFSTARVTKDQLLLLSELDAVTSVFQGDLLYALNDLAVSHSGAGLVHDAYLGSTAYDGTDVIVLVIDTGIDWSHLDFRDPDTPTTSRILRIWDQTIDSTSTSDYSPARRDVSNFPGLTYGVEYLQTDINDEIDGSAAGFVRTEDSNGHGTEVASGAVGNGASLSSKKYKGMAPDADIVVVRAGQSASFEDAKVKDALTYAQKIASYYSKPVVVNLSLGSQSNAHDGTSTLDAAVNTFTSSGNGRVAVIAAGNAGNELIHKTGTINPSSMGSIVVNVPSFYPINGKGNDAFFMEVWLSHGGDATFTMVTPGLQGVQRTAGQDPEGASAATSGAVQMNNIIDSDHTNGDRMSEIVVFDYVTAGGDTVQVAEGNWTLQITNNSDATFTYHAWMYQSTMGATLTGGDHNSTIASPGTASSAITVGAYTARWRWNKSSGAVSSFGSPDESDDYSYFSSVGPTREGDVRKPDIMTPGQGVITTTSTDYTPYAQYEIIADKYHVEQGTSVAAGSVSGAVALLLDYNSSLSAADVKTLLRENADSDTYTGTVPNDEWGYGKLNIFESLAKEINTSTTIHHDVYIYDSWNTLGATSFADTYKEAVRFTPTTQGDVSGAFFHTHTAVGSSGSISFEIWSDYQGGPSVKQGSTVTLSVTDIGKYSWNYVSLVDAGVRVQASTDYHLVIDNTSGAPFSLLKETTSEIDLRSTGWHGGPTWGAFDEFDWLIRPVVATNEADTDYSLPVELAFFNAGAYKGQMVLKWATESETENLGFQIDRRKSGTEDWKLIADHTKNPKLEGQGNSTSRTDYIYYDKTAKPGVSYDYRLTDIPYTDTYTPSSIVLEDIKFRIEKFALHKNFPNPFNPATTIGYELAKNSAVQIKIVDVTGREIQSWNHESKEAGYHEMIWAGVNQSGKPVSAGLYLLSVQAGNQFQTRKLLLLK